MNIMRAGLNLSASIFNVLILCFILFNFLFINSVMAEEEREKSLIMACKYLPLHNDFSGYSEPLALVGFGTPVKVSSFENFIKVLIVQEEECDEYEQTCDDQETEKSPEYEEVPTWAKIEVKDKTGYVPIRCLVTKEVFKRQAPEAALKKATVADLKGGSRGFSEEEEGDLVAMRGAGGKVKGGKANYERLDKLLKKAPEYNPQPALEEFRKNGQLGEFK
jgi:hypothetical protein